MKQRATHCILLLAALLLVAGCSRLNVNHLGKRPWLADTPQSIDMKFWRFEFRNMPLKHGVGLQGTAFPNTELFPQWATWYDQLSFTAYLSSSSGAVISSSTVDILPRPLGNERAIPFEFRLEPGEHSEAMYVSFGYRMVLAEQPWKPDAPRQGRIHMAHEGALTQ